MVSTTSTFFIPMKREKRIFFLRVHIEAGFNAADQQDGYYLISK
jgi:hypothetical protein